MGRGLKAKFTRKINPEVCAQQFVWMGSGAIKLEDGTKVIRADKGGQPFFASWKWLAIKHDLLCKQLLTVEQYEARGFKLTPPEG